MFYLREFTRLLKTHFFMTLTFLFSIFGMMSVIGQKDSIHQHVSQFQKSNMSTYFNALVSGTSNISGISRKMKDLPGVLDVVVTTKAGLSKEIDHLSSSFGTDTISKLSSLNYQKIKIELEEEVSKKNQSLIREYLGRLIGTDNVTMGAVKEAKGLKLNQKDPLFKMLNYAEYYLLSLCFIFFVITSSVLMKSIRSRAFIISKFQRRSKVGLKIFLSGILCVYAPTLLFNLTQSSSSPWILALPTLLVLSVVFIHSFQELVPNRVSR